MRTSYQAAPWKAATTPLARSLSFAGHAPQRLGDPSAFFSKAPFIPARPIGAPMIGGVDRTLIVVNESAPRPDMETILDQDSWGSREPVEGVDITRPICRCKFASNSQLGQGCSKPSSGGSGSAEFGAGESPATASSGPSLGTVAVVGVVGLGALYLLGII